MKNIIKLDNFIFLLIILLILFSGCATQKQVTRSQVKSKAEKVFIELEKIEKQQPVPTLEIEEGVEKMPTKQQEQTQTKPQKVEKPLPVIFNKEVIEFEETGEGVASKYERTIDAEKRAEEDALSKALKKVGTDVYYGFSDTLAQYGKTQYQFVARYLYTWSSGLASYERVGEPVFTTTADGGIKCTVKIRGKIYSKGPPDPNYEIRIDMKDKPLGLDKSVYYSGDEVHLSFWITKDSYITILNVDEEQNVSLIYPNKYTTSAILKAGEIFEIPGNSGITLKVYLPEGRSETVELLHIIATKKEPLFTPEETKEMLSNEYRIFSLGKLQKVIQRLAKLNRSDWTHMVLPYTIRSR